MAKQIKATFTIKVSGSKGNYTILAEGPNRIEVEEQPFNWNPTTEQNETIRQLETKPRRVSQDKLEALGKAMYQAIFTPGIAMAFGRIQESLKEGGARIRLVIEPLELSRLPWEMMHDGKDYITLRSNYPLVRGRSSETSFIRRTAIRGSLRILYVWAQTGAEDLELEAPAEKIRQLLGENKRIRFDILPHATLDKLRTALLKEYHILCFAGHGTEDHIYLESDKGSERLSATQFRRELEGKDIRVVFLAACKTAAIPSEELAGFAQSLADQVEVPAVVAMQYEIYDEEANRLTARFFETLSSFRPVDIALAESRKAIMDDSKLVVDIFTPVLYLQAEDGALFQRGRNWIALGFGILFIIAFTALIIQSLFFQPDRNQISFAQSTARAESTLRAVSEATKEAASTQAIIELNNKATAEAIAETQKNIANQEARISRSNELANLSSQIPDWQPQLKLLLAIEAVKSLHPTDPMVPASEQAIRNSLRFAHGIRLGEVGGQVAFSPDDKQLIVGDNFGKLYIFDLESLYTPIPFIRDVGAPIQNLTFSSDNQWLLVETESGSSIWIRNNDLPEKWVRTELLQDSRLARISNNSNWVAYVMKNKIMIRSLINKNELPTQLPFDDKTIKIIEFIPDDHRLAIVTDENFVGIWNFIAPTSEIINWIEVDDNPIETMLLLPNGTGMILSSETNIGFWEFDGSEQIKNQRNINTQDTFESFSKVGITSKGTWLIYEKSMALYIQNLLDPDIPIYTINGGFGVEYSISPDEKWIFMTAGSGATSFYPTMILQNLDSLPRIEQYTIFGHESIVEKVTFSPRGNWIITQGSNELRIWDFNELPAPCFHGRPNDFIFVSGGDHYIRCGISETSASTPLPIITNNRRWFLISKEKQLYVIDTVGLNFNKPQLILEPDCLITSIAISSDDQYLLTGCVDGKLKLWDLALPDKGLENPTILSGHSGEISGSTFSFNNKWLITSSKEQTLIWNLSKNPLESIKINGFYKFGYTVLFTPDEKKMILSNENNSLVIYSLQNNEITELQLLQNQSANPRDTIMSTDGRWLFTKDLVEHTIKIWDLNSFGKLITPISSNQLLDSRKILLTRDNKYLLTISEPSVLIFDFNNLVDPVSDYVDPIYSFLNPTNAWDFDVSSDSRWIIMGDHYQVTFLDMTNQISKIIPTGLSKFFDLLTISKDSSRLAISSSVGLLMWDLNQIEAPPVKLDPNYGGQSFFNFENNDDWLVSYDKLFGSVDIWLLDVNVLVRKACLVAGRNLTIREWNQFFQNENYRKTCEEWPEGQ